MLYMRMRKRERENPCTICGHYHKYEEGEVCGICGHRVPVTSEKTSVHVSAFSSEILPEFLYLGSYDNASRNELLKAQGISHILNTVPACQNLYKNSFTYHCLEEDRVLQFDNAVQFLEQCERKKARVLVHCMSGKSRSPAIVIAFLMKSRGWRLQQSYQWVKERRSSVQVSQGVYQQLQEYEQKIFGPVENSTSTPSFPNPSVQAFNFGLTKPNDQVSLPAFGAINGTTSIFAAPLNVPPHGFTFGAGQTQTTNPTGNDISMDSV